LLIVVLSGVEHHLHDTLDMTIGRRQPADIKAEAPCNRRPNLIFIKDLTLDLTRLEDILGESLKGRFVT